MKTWKNFETNNPNVKEYLRVWLKLNEIRFEISECFDGWHFEILGNVKMQIDSWIRYMKWRRNYENVYQKNYVLYRYCTVCIWCIKY